MKKNEFNVYIDESGDEGFKVKDEAWLSSQWFVIGALVVPKEFDREMASTINEIKNKLSIPESKPLHFTKLHHAKRKFVVNKIVEKKNFICSYVAFCKPKTPIDSKLRTEKGYLYNYCVRFLVERISWLVDDRNGVANLTFENRSNTKYDELVRYIRDLEQNPEVQIRNNTISTIETLNKNQSKNLQIADAITGSLFQALEKNEFDDVEPSYILNLKRNIYRKNGNFGSYGLKLFKEPLDSPEIINNYPWTSVFAKNKKIAAGT